MRSQSDARSHARLAATLALVVTTSVTSASPAPSSDSSPPGVSSVPTDAQITAAVKALDDDPNLGANHKVNQLRWRNGREKQNQPPKHPRGWGWLEGLLAWIAQAGRVFVWVVCIVIAGVLAIVILRLIQARHPRDAKIGFTAPSHVRDLDIRPESLPADIPEAAMQLWNRGEHRAALALLYRGTLSRMAHVHGVPVVHSNTEGEVDSLAAQHLASTRATYVADLVGVWQRAVYGHEDPTLEAVRRLCAGFEPALGPDAHGAESSGNASPAGASA